MEMVYNLSGSQVQCRSGKWEGVMSDVRAGSSDSRVHAAQGRAAWGEEAQSTLGGRQVQA